MSFIYYNHFLGLDARQDAMFATVESAENGDGLAFG
jgi:hypothetical protein